MLTKIAQIPEIDEYGFQRVIPFFRKGEGLEKYASLPDGVQRYIDHHFTPKDGSVGLLVTAMGAGEYWGSNCFPAGSPVRTLSGEVPIEAVQVGQEVLTHRNRYRRVLRTMARPYDGELVDLWIAGLPDLAPALSATPNHEMWVVTAEEMSRKRKLFLAAANDPNQRELHAGDWRWRMVHSLEFSWRPIGKLRKGDYVSEPFPLDEIHGLGGIWGSEAAAFLMGLYAADGYLTQRVGGKPTGIVLVLERSEKKLIRAVFRAVEQLGCLITSRYTGPVAQLQIGSSELAMLCADHIGTSPETKVLSQTLLQMPCPWQTTFFRAYCHGNDGKDQGGVLCASSSLGMLRSLRLILARLGVVSFVRVGRGVGGNRPCGDKTYELQVVGGRSGRVGLSESYIHPSGCILTQVRKTTRRPWKGTIYNLHVAEDNSYTTGGMFVHNSNGDWFYEKSLVHLPSGWTDDPDTDRILAKGWPYGYPTFYHATAFTHHQNKDPNRGIGHIDYVTWDPLMHWVLAVVIIDEKKADRHNGRWVLDRISQGRSVPWSMGCFVAGSPVTTSDGRLVPIEEIRAGDLILNAYGKPAAVTELHRRPYTGKLIRVVPAGGIPIRATSEHPFLIVHPESGGASRKTWVYASALREGDLIACPRVPGRDPWSDSLRRETLSDGTEVVPIESVGPEALIYRGDVYNFEVDSGSSYVVSGAGVHNCRVPFDLSSLTPDYDRYEKAWSNYDPRRHKSPAEAILWEHDKVKKIAGLSRTRREYPDELLYHMNEIQPDGRKVYAINDFPLFFDLSAVGVPADQVAWSITKLGASRCELAGHACSGGCRGGTCRKFVPPGVVLWDRVEEYMSKSASVHAASLGKGGAIQKGSVIGKGADIDKQITPSVMDAKDLSSQKDERKSEKSEKDERDREDRDEREARMDDFPRELLDRMGSMFDLGSALSTPSLLGMILRPREFRRIVLVRMGKRDLADHLDDIGAGLPFSFESEKPADIEPGLFDDGLAKMLLPFLGHRSCLGPVVHRTKIIIVRAIPKDEKTSDREPEVQRKVASLYNGYRKEMLQKIAGVREVVAAYPWLRSHLYGMSDLDKTGSLTFSLVPLITERTLEHLRAF